MEVLIGNIETSGQLSKPFWVLWMIELWERFGYYGVKAILALYFVQWLGYSERQSFYIFGSYGALVCGFVWIGGWIGDNYLGAKRTLVLGATILMISYACIALSSKQYVFYALAGIVIGNSLFKANPTSIISKLYDRESSGLDRAMTYYYMAINIGSMLSMAITPIIAKTVGWPLAFWICSLGLALGLGNYCVYSRLLDNFGTRADVGLFPYKKFSIVLIGCMVMWILCAQILTYTKLCSILIYSVVAIAFIYYLKVAFTLNKRECIRMLVALVLIIQGTIFFILYNQMPTSLTFFALHNVNNHILGWNVPAAEYQVLNPLVIVVMTPVLAWWYLRFHSTHVTKFCLGMSLCALAYLILVIPHYFSSNGLVSPWWMVLTYFFQSVGELLISGLGLAMVASLCPRNMSGYVMGIWWLTNMLAGPLGAWVSVLTAPAIGYYSVHMSLIVYSEVFERIGIATTLIAILMWVSRPFLIRCCSDTVENLTKKVEKIV